MTAELAFDVAGEGPPVVLLHSGAADGRMWAHQVGALDSRHRVLVPDLPGSGRTPLEPGPNDPVAGVVAVLDRCGIERAAIVGSSRGGRIALELAGRHPERVERLLLLCPAYPWAPPDLDEDGRAAAFAAEEARLLDAGRLDDAAELHVSTWLGAEADAATRDSLRVMQRHALEVAREAQAWTDPPTTVRVEPDLAALTAPTAVFSGGRDLLYFRGVARHLAAALPQARLAELPWAAHLPSLERPEEVARVLIEALDGTSPADLSR